MKTHELIDFWRDNLGDSELAEKTKITYPRIRELLSGEGIPTSDEIFKISEVCKIPVPFFSEEYMDNESFLMTLLDLILRERDFDIVEMSKYRDGEEYMADFLVFKELPFRAFIDEFKEDCRKSEPTDDDGMTITAYEHHVRRDL